MLDSPVKKSLLDLSTRERENRFKAVLKNVLAERKAQNVPIVYRNSLCVSRNQFIHEYPNGQKFLIRQNQNNSEEKIIREL
jgi:hypothetical protein